MTHFDNQDIWVPSIPGYLWSFFLIIQVHMFIWILLFKSNNAVSRNNVIS